MSKIELNNVSSGYNLAEINVNFQKIEDALNNLVLYRNPPDGEPNTLEKDLDVNGKGLLNVGDLTVEGKSLSSFVTEAEASATAAALSETNAAVSEGNAATSETNAAASASIVADWEWKGAWASSTAYAINNIVSNSGSTYICTIAHTSSGSFDSGNWEILAQQGAGGAGTGDMVGANNLSELTNTSVARTNIGLGSVNNTSDANKPVSTAQQTALDGKQATLVSGTNVKTLNGVSILGAGDLVVAVADGDKGDITVSGSGAVWTIDQKLTVMAPVTASGTAVDFTGIPSWAKRITVLFDGVSTNGTSMMLIQLGDSGGIETTGYVSCAEFVEDNSGGALSTAGLAVSNVLVAAASYRGMAIIAHLGSNAWAFQSQVNNASTSLLIGAGSKTLSDVLTQLRITMANGTDTFDGGTIGVMYE